jgi:Major Facilitator Superfamily.
MLWLLFGYNVVTTTFLVTFGRLSDIFGRVRLYNLGFAVFTLGSILLSLTPGKGDQGALELILFRIVQGIGASFLFANSAAIITDAFPSNERGKALGGILANSNWRYVFLVSVPFGVFGTIWSYSKLKELGVRQKNQKIDMFGNTTFGVCLTLVLIGVTTNLQKSANEVGKPWVISSIAIGALLLIRFSFYRKACRATDV